MFDPLTPAWGRLALSVLVAAVLLAGTLPALVELGVQVPVVSGWVKGEESTRHAQEREWVREQQR